MVTMKEYPLMCSLVEFTNVYSMNFMMVPSNLCTHRLPWLCDTCNRLLQVTICLPETADCTTQCQSFIPLPHGLIPVFHHLQASQEESYMGRSELASWHVKNRHSLLAVEQNPCLGNCCRTYLCPDFLHENPKSCVTLTTSQLSFFGFSF